MKNKMAEVAKIWNLELWEIFRLEGCPNDYAFSLNGLVEYTSDGVWKNSCADLINEILVGKTKIIKHPYLPTETDMYYSLNLFDGSNKIVKKSWNNTQDNYLDYYIGNCFKSKEDISADVSTELLQKIAKPYRRSFDEGMRKKASPIKQKNSV